MLISLLTLIIFTSCDKSLNVDNIEEVVITPSATVSCIISTVTLVEFGSHSIQADETKSFNAKQGDVFSLKYVPTTYNMSNGSYISGHFDNVHNTLVVFQNTNLFLDGQE